MNNLFDGIAESLPVELVDVLAESRSVRIERIVSRGHKSPDGFWYDQEEHEWVVVLRGEARLEFANEDHLVHLRAGDFVHIAAHRRHRVAWTSAREATIWLAVFYRVQ